MCRLSNSQSNIGDKTVTLLGSGRDVSLRETQNLKEPSEKRFLNCGLHLLPGNWEQVSRGGWALSKQNVFWGPWWIWEAVYIRYIVRAEHPTRGASLAAYVSHTSSERLLASTGKEALAYKWKKSGSLSFSLPVSALTSTWEFWSSWLHKLTLSPCRGWWWWGK